MFKKKIFLTNEYISIGKEKIPWKSIDAIRIKGEFFPQFITKGLPSIDFFLKNGNFISVFEAENNFYYKTNDGDHIKKISINKVISVVREKKINIKSAKNILFEWKFIQPVIILQVVSIFISILNSKSLEQLIPLYLVCGLIGTTVGAIIGFILVKREKKTNK